MDLISVIIPVYNSEKTIKRCLDSLLKQSYPYFELIVVNDGSKDHSKDIIDSYDDERIVAIHKQNEGVSATRNKGITSAKGKYICFVDSDDYVEVDYLKMMIEQINKDKSDLVICNFKRLDHNGLNINECSFNTKKMEINEMIYEIYTKSLLNQPWNKLFIKDKISKLFSLDLSLGEDLLFVIDYLKNCYNISYVEDCLYVYDLLDGGGLSFLKQSETEFLALYAYLFDELLIKNEYSLTNFSSFLLKHYLRFCINTKKSLTKAYPYLMDFAKKYQINTIAYQYFIYLALGLAYLLKTKIKK